MSAWTQEEEDIYQSTGMKDWTQTHGNDEVRIGVWLVLLEFGPEQVGFRVWKRGREEGWASTTIML